MPAAPIAHVGILVDDLEGSKDHWSKVLEESFSPIVRYRPAGWSFGGEFTPGAAGVNELRQTIYYGVNPSIEIQQFVENGTHSHSRGEGGHHLGFPPVQDTEAKREELAAYGVEIAGAVKYENREIIQFTSHEDLDKVSTEWVELSQGHLDLKDNGEDVNRLPNGDGTVFEVDKVLADQGTRPESNLKVISIGVMDLTHSMKLWNKVSGRIFTLLEGKNTEAISDVSGANIKLIQVSDDKKVGIQKLTFKCENLHAKRAELIGKGVPITLDTLNNIVVDSSYLNNVSVEFTDL